MNCLVTGCAGFIGSHLIERLLTLGHRVAGIDSFIPYYESSIKRRNLASALTHPNFRFLELDLRSDAIESAVLGADVVFHLAAMPGLTRSWTDFDLYESCNVQATQRLIQAIRDSDRSIQRFIYVSTSSVYGRTASGDESQPTQPISPYGVTKLAGENLCRAYADAFDLPIVILRYFSVYGPRQRPDMGYYKFIQSMLHDKPIVMYGDGEQIRGNTYVADCVDATIAAAGAPIGEIYNVGGGETASVWDVLKRLEAIAGRPAKIQHEPARAGDQRHTKANTEKLIRDCGWRPQTTLDTGLFQQWEWQKGEME